MMSLYVSVNLLALCVTCYRITSEGPDNPPHLKEYRPRKKAVKRSLATERRQPGLVLSLYVYIHLLTLRVTYYQIMSEKGETKIAARQARFTRRPVLTDGHVLAVSSIGAIRVNVRAFYLGLPVRGYPSGVARLGFGSWRVSHITRPDTASGIVSVDGKSRRGGAMACAGKLGLVSSAQPAA